MDTINTQEVEGVLVVILPVPVLIRRPYVFGFHVHERSNTFSRDFMSWVCIDYLFHNYT